MVNILVYSNSVVFYIGLKSITSDEKDYQIAGCARNSNELKIKIDNLRPDIIIVDYNELNIAILNRCQEYKKNDKCMLLILGKIETLKSKVKESFDGILSANGTAMELIESIRYFAKQLGTKINLGNTETFLLTKREKEILQLLITGETTINISRKLIISNHTTKKHISNIFQKLHVTNRIQAVTKIFTEKLTNQQKSFNCSKRNT